ncbi:IS3 family transposase [Photobacterium angustum]|nr:IS3 family transposase [Photobacterium angustum]
MLQVIKQPRSVFYYQAKASKHHESYADERALITSIFHQHKGRYGYRRIHLELRNQGIMINHKTVQRFMGQLNLKSIVRPKRYCSYKCDIGKTTPNILNRNFTATRPDEKWVTDVTEFKVKKQKVYLSPVVDLFTQEVVVYNVTNNARLLLVIDMLTSALSKLKVGEKTIIHSN